MLNKETSQTLVDKWSPILEGVSDSYTRETTAVLLENQARHILNEAQKDGMLSEATPGNGPTTVGSIGTFQKFAFPLVRRVFPELIANKVVGVQPMQGPVSQIFYLGYDRLTDQRRQTLYSKYDLTYGQRTIGDAQSLYPSTAAGAAGSSLDELVAAGGDSLNTTSGDLSGNLKDISSTVGGEIAAFPLESTTVGFDVSSGEVLGKFVPSPNGTALSDLTGYNSHPNGVIPEINFHIEQQPVTARTRKFRALWTLEAAQDLRAYHNLDLERELTDLLGKEVALEIDRELIEDMRGIAYDITGGMFERSLMDMPNSNNITGAGRNGKAFEPGDFLYDFTGGGTAPGGGLYQSRNNVFFVDFASTALDLSPRHVGQAYANLLAVLNFASQDIYKTTYRGAGNYLITSPFVAAILNSAAKLEGGVKAGNWEGQLGANINYAGKLQGMFDVYVDPLYPDDEILMGYKGSSPMDAGFVYSPYIPLQMLPTITDPETFQPRKGLLTRYGKAAVTPESRFFRIIRIIGAGSNYLFRPGAVGGNVS
jgi:hypothetical protein